MERRILCVRAEVCAGWKCGAGLLNCGLEDRYQVAEQVDSRDNQMLEGIGTERPD